MKETQDVEANSPIVLVPELCYMTGITDKMRSDFRVMKDIAVYTRLTPQQRNDGLRKFIQNLKGTSRSAFFWGNLKKTLLWLYFKTEFTYRTYVFV